MHVSALPRTPSDTCLYMNGLPKVSEQSRKILNLAAKNIPIFFSINDPIEDKDKLENLKTKIDLLEKNENSDKRDAFLRGTLNLAFLVMLVVSPLFRKNHSEISVPAFFIGLVGYVGMGIYNSYRSNEDGSPYGAISGPYFAMNEYFYGIREKIEQTKNEIRSLESKINSNQEDLYTILILENQTIIHDFLKNEMDRINSTIDKITECISLLNSNEIHENEYIKYTLDCQKEIQKNLQNALSCYQKALTEFDSLSSYLRYTLLNSYELETETASEEDRLLEFIV